MFPARALPWLTWGLVFHVLFLTILVGIVRLPIGTVRAIAAWKELAGIVLLLVVVVHAATGRGVRVTVCAADLLAGAWLALAVVTFATENVVWRENVPLDAAVFGVRDAAFFVIFYFIGRSTPQICNDDRFMKRAFVILCVTSIIAIGEQLFVTPQMLVLLGVASFMKDFVGAPAFTVGNVYGLPANYWSMMGSHMVRRSGSIFLSGQGFAQIFVLFLPAATIWALQRRHSRAVWVRLGYAAIWTGLLVTFTRAAIAVGALQLAILLVRRQRFTGLALATSVGLIVLLAGIAVVPGLATFILETVTWQTGSSASHLKDWSAGLTAFFEQPWGYGLGTADMAASRAGLDPLTADNLYLKYAVELGLPGAIAVVGTLVAFLAAGVRLSRWGETENQRAMGVTVALATLGVVVYGMTAVMLTDPLIAYLLFWFGGTAVTLSQRVHLPASVMSPAYA